MHLKQNLQIFDFIKLVPQNQTNKLFNAQWDAKIELNYAQYMQKIYIWNYATIIVYI